MAFDQTIPEIQTPNIVGNALAAYGQGQDIGLKNQAIQNQNQLAQLSSQAYGTTDPQAQNDLLSQMAQISPEHAWQQKQEFAAMNQEQQQQAAAQMDSVARMAAAVGSIQDPQQKEAAWNQLLNQAKASGINVTPYQGLPADLGVRMALSRIASSKDLLGMAGLGGDQGVVVNPGGQLVNKSTGGVMFSSPQKPIYEGSVPRGDGTTQAGFIDPVTHQFSPVTSGGDQGMSWIAGLPQETQKYVPNVLSHLGGKSALNPDGTPSDALMNALIAVESGGNPNATSPKGAAGLTQLMPATAASVGVSNPYDPNQNINGGRAYLGQLINQFGGDVPKAIAAYNAGPGAVQKAALPFGVAPPKGKAADDTDQPLTPEQESEAQAIAKYALPVNSYSLSKPNLAPVLARVMQINPDFNAGQYSANQKLLTGLASSTPGSLGGSIVAAGTALQHLNELANISQQLPTHAGWINAISNGVQNAANVGDAPALAQWNTAKGLLAGELSKMVKGGVASEGEVNQLLSNLNPNDPNRDQALGTLAKLMTEKVGQLEQQRGQVLGQAAPQTSFFNAQQQALAKRLTGLAGSHEDLGLLPPNPGIAGQQQPQPAASGWSIQRVQ